MQALFALCAMAAAAVLLPPTGQAATAKKPAPTVAEPTPVPGAAMVNSFHTALLDALKASNGKGFANRQKAYAPVVDASFDSAFMAKIAAGKYWEGFTPAQQKELAQALRDLTVANYASRFKSYNGQVFEVVEEKPAPGDDALVRTRLLRKSGDPVNISYRLSKRDAKSGWTIIDVWLNNAVSELALRRSEFGPVLRDKGLAGLLDTLRAKTAALAEQDATSKSY